MTGTNNRVLQTSLVAFALFSAAAGARLLYGFDLLALRAAQTRTSETLAGISKIVSTLGDVEYAGLALAVLAAGLLWNGQQRLAKRLVAAFVATGLLEIVLKFLLPQTPVRREFVRSTDPSPLVEIDYPFPYPSGHMLRAVIVLGALFLLWRHGLARAAILLGLAGMAASRVYLGVHWASDLVGGALLGLAGLAWTFRAYKR